MDITLCKENRCSLKENCLRFKGKPNELYQSYFFGELPIDGTCEFYYPIKKENKNDKTKQKEN